jgi:hypothetical protein
MHPNWIRLLLAAERSSSGQSPNSVAFREWLLSFLHNCTPSWWCTDQSSYPLPEPQPSLLYILSTFSGDPRGAARQALGSPQTNAQVWHTPTSAAQNYPRPDFPSPKVSSMLLTYQENSWSWMLTDPTMNARSPTRTDTHQSSMLAWPHTPVITLERAILTFHLPQHSTKHNHKLKVNYKVSHRYLTITTLAGNVEITVWFGLEMGCRGRGWGAAHELMFKTLKHFLK